MILISTSNYVHLCDIFQSLVLIISHLYRNKQKRKKKKKGVEFSRKWKPQCWQQFSVRTEEGCVIWCELIKDINSMMNRASLLRLLCKFTFWFYFWVKIRKYILYWTQILINMQLNHALIGFMNIFSASALVHRKNLTHHVAAVKEIRYQNQLNFIHILPNYNSYLKVLYIAT